MRLAQARAKLLRHREVTTVDAVCTVLLFVAGLQDYRVSDSDDCEVSDFSRFFLA